MLSGIKPNKTANAVLALEHIGIRLSPDMQLVPVKEHDKIRARPRDVKCEMVVSPPHVPPNELQTTQHFDRTSIG